tara:strand:- start:3534 stop:3710 length:177 start_codon:yes stop_codon:yes gene_type:complete
MPVEKLTKIKADVSSLADASTVADRTNPQTRQIINVIWRGSIVNPKPSRLDVNMGAIT